MLLKGAMRGRQALKTWCLAEMCHGDEPEACIALRGTGTQTHLASCVCQQSLTPRSFCGRSGPQEHTRIVLLKVIRVNLTYPV